MVYFDQSLGFYLFYYCPTTGMSNSDEASPSIILAGRALLVKMLITLDLHGIFASHFVFYSIGENAHNS